MFLIRQARPSDTDILLKLARMVHFINLPADKEVIAEKIGRAQQSFEAARQGGAYESSPGRPPLYMFVMEESSTGNALGTSSIIAKMGTKGNPNIGMQLRRRELFSRDLQQGVTHVTAQLVLDEDGPTEIGGLIVIPSYRGHPEKLGMQLSLVRFHYIGLHRRLFEERLLAEMMGALTPEGGNTLWEYFGRRFINLSYTEADRFCAYSREFMTSLLPREEIYLTLLPPEARALIGQVGPETRPARAMLEKLGFRYHDRCDPFDGGPHLQAQTADVQLVRDTRRTRLLAGAAGERGGSFGFVSFEAELAETGEREFRALYTRFEESTDGSAIRISGEAMESLGAEAGDEVGLTPLARSEAGAEKNARKPAKRERAAR
jgi:arginine N-succinyltransferase